MAVEKIDRPSALAADADACAITILGNAMWPRFRTGRRLLVSPAASIAEGDDVVVRLAGGGVLIKELVRRSASVIELRQLNPAKTFAVNTADVTAIHKVVGEAI